MATPTNVRITAPSTGKVRAGRPSLAFNDLVDQIAAAPPHSWVKVSANRFQDSWPSVGFRAPYASNSPDQLVQDQASPTDPAAVLRAWCSFAWDDDAMRLITFGGGHGNSSGNEVYMWDGATKSWALAFYPTSVVYPNATCGHRSSAGSLNAPVSAHTYSNQAWLPHIQRFITFGGASYNTGDSWNISDEAGNILRKAGPFTLNMALAGQGYVSATTGSNVKRPGTESFGVSLPGANAWKCRDWKNNPGNTVAAYFMNLVGRSICVTEEGGVDVIYAHANHGTSKDLIRVEIHDPDDYTQDVLTHVGATWSNQVSDACACLDTKRKFFFNPSYYTPNSPDMMGGWDLSAGKPGPNNKFISCPPSGVIGPAAAEFVANASQTRYGNLYDERRDRIIVFSRQNALYSIKPPDNGIYTTGWSVSKLAGDAEFAGIPSEESYQAGHVLASPSLTGRWKRSRKLDVYIWLTNNYDGNVWMFKPRDWLDPRTA